MAYDDFFLQDDDIQKIINAHCNDFTYNTYKTVIEKYGGYKEYVKSLGGIFAKYADFKGKIKTKQELYDCMNYVWGLYNIWGTDYSNGCSYDDWTENRYKAKAGAVSAFYPSKAPISRFQMNYSAYGFANGADLPDVDSMLSAGKYYAITNCGEGVVQTLKKAGLVPSNFPDPAYYPKLYADQGYKYQIIKNASDLQVGDVMLFFNRKIQNRSDKTTLQNWESGLFHTAIVGKRDSKYIYMFDSGHAFTYYGECINRRKIGDNQVYQWAADWLAIRLDCIANLIDVMNGWKKVSDKWYYFEDGEKITGWKYISGVWYYFNESGIMQTGWQKLKWSQGIDWFYFRSSGAMATGWIKWKNNWYYCDEKTGAMLTGDHTVMCHLDETGALKERK